MTKTRKRNDDHGVRIYSRALLFIYDFLIYRILNPLVWRCDPKNYRNLYQTGMSRNHADIGVGTGYFLNRCRFQPGTVRIGLFDLQQNSLDYCAHRLARFQPETYLRNAMVPMHIPGARFDSIGMGGILHCIPGDFSRKCAVFDSIRPLMKAQTRVFGYTIVNQEIRKTWRSRGVYFLLQKLKVINGLHDAPSQLAAELNKRFRYSAVTVIGCIALFTAQDPISNA